MVCLCEWDYFLLHYQQWVHCSGCGICSWCCRAEVCVFVCMWVFPLRSLCQFKSVWHTATHWSLNLQQAQRKTHTIVYCLWFSSVRSSHLCLGTVRIYFKRLLRSLWAARNHLKLQPGQFQKTVVWEGHGTSCADHLPVKPSIPFRNDSSKGSPHSNTHKINCR